MDLSEAMAMPLWLKVLAAAYLMGAVAVDVSRGQQAPSERSGGSHLLTDSQRAGHRIRNLRKVRGSDHTVMIIAFDYATGAAFRIVQDETSGKVLYEQQLPGRPQSSREEFKEAVEIIGRDPKLAGFIRDGAVTEGGFIVDGPPDHPRQDRYIQIRLLTPNRGRLLRVVLVDLTVSAVASASDWFQ